MLHGQAMITTVTSIMTSEDPPGDASAAADNHDSLKYQLLGPSLTKAGQDTVDQQKVGRGKVSP